jgi:6,7-dimethyl-8-ribityllumazine synthase
MPSTRYDAASGSAGAPIEGARVHTGNLDAAGMRMGIVVSRFNDIISTRLLDGAVATLRERGVADGGIEVVWVPGAFEIPIAARELAQLGDVDAIVCLGAVIRGDTPHFDYVAGGAADGIASVHAMTGVPATFGVLTVDTVEQANDRAGGRLGNKGSEAAEAAIEMASLVRDLRRRRAVAQRAVS